MSQTNEYAADKPWKLARAQKIMEAGYGLFSAQGIEKVTMPEVAEASGVSRATLFRYFPTKLDLVVAIGTWKFDDILDDYESRLTPDAGASMTASERMRRYLDGYLDLYHNHHDLLRFNYNFNGYLSHRQKNTFEQRQPYMDMVDGFKARFHEIYELGLKDHTLNTDISEASMFSSSFHIMLAAVTRYAAGLVYVSDGTDPEDELVMLADLLFTRYVARPDRSPDTDPDVM